MTSSQALHTPDRPPNNHGGAGSSGGGHQVGGGKTPGTPGTPGTPAGPDGTPKKISRFSSMLRKTKEKQNKSAVFATMALGGTADEGSAPTKVDKLNDVTFKEHIEIRTSLAKAELNMLLDEHPDQYAAVAAGKQCARCPKTFGFFALMTKTQCNMCASIICKNCAIDLDVSGFLGKEAGMMTLCVGHKGCKGYLGGHVSM